MNNNDHWQLLLQASCKSDVSTESCAHGYCQPFALAPYSGRSLFWNASAPLLPWEPLPTAHSLGSCLYAMATPCLHFGSRHS